VTEITLYQTEIKAYNANTQDSLFFGISNKPLQSTYDNMLEMVKLVKTKQKMTNNNNIKLSFIIMK